MINLLLLLLYIDGSSIYELASPQKPDDQTTSETESFQDQGSKNVTVTSDDNRVEGCTSLNDECLEKVESVVSHQTYSQNRYIQDGSSQDLKNDDHKDEGCADSRKKCQVVTKILTETAVRTVSDTNFGDPSTWPFPLLPSFKDSLIKKGPVQCILEKYPKVDGRGFHRCQFTNTSTDSLKNNKLSISIYKLWDKFTRIFKIKMHEDSHQHMLADVAWSNYVYRLENGQTIDENATALSEKESSSWKLVLKCMLDVLTNVDIPESNLDKFEREFFKNLLERIIEKFGGRFQALRVVASEFGFMWGHQLESNSTPDLINAVKDLALKYHEDLDGAKMLQEIGALKSSVEPFVPQGNRYLRRQHWIS
ncbi:unnamed protein product [Orchesella dallaii]|uniref:Uncharacterized protein n=1 Tax=Orchesella dallaii TaxID=48710 RepID=A0ABP1S9F1_9HEXA